MSRSVNLICNNIEQKRRIISEMEKNLRLCDSFDFSVAFIADSGLAALRQVLIDLNKKGIKGKIITSTYLGFNNPKMFYQLLDFDNIDVRIYQKEGFHPKGYIFNNQSDCEIIIGSANLTQSALTINQEWNISLTSKYDCEIINRIKEEYQLQWEDSIPLTKQWIEDYEKNYIPLDDRYIKNRKEEFSPNQMQQEALNNLDNLRAIGKNKALLISATGTGKTFLSAFDTKQFNANRVLFVVHRENIARTAMKSFQRIHQNKSFGIFTGNEKNIGSDYIFCTIQTLGKEEYLKKFTRDYFDYIIIDEVHHASAPSYQKLLSYFKPKFLLGMTATPERTDDIDVIYKMFDYNVAYEIRLQQAMEYDLLCPFNYYGISDLTIDNEVINDKSEIRLLADEQRADHIIKAIKDYKYSGDKVHGLIFVSRQDEAKSLSDIFNTKGYKTVALTGDDDEEIRKKYIDRLESEDDDYLDYIFTVNIFNEGIDIPCINQVVMARPTSSAIVFIQQLGRGLRKYGTKEYVNVIDIIGNYENNFMIPIALSGNYSYNKDALRKFIYDGNAMIAGSSTISFDDITKKRIYEKIDNAKFNSKDLIRKSYKELRAKLGCIPSLFDFDKFGSIDPLKIFDEYGSYYSLLKDKKAENDYKLALTDLELEFIEYVSKKFANGKRIHELELINLLISGSTQPFDDLKTQLKNQYCIKYNDACTVTIENELTHQFATGTNANNHKNCIFLENRQISKTFASLLENSIFKDMLLEIIKFGINRFNKQYKNRYKDTDLVLYEKYTYDNVCQLLNWNKSEVSQNIGGYKYDKPSNTFPVFINYNKQDVSDSINYEDHFIDKQHLIALSKSRRSLESNDVMTIVNAKNNNTQIHLFVRKNKEDKDTAKEFYYLGLMNLCEPPKQIVMKNTNYNAVEFMYELDVPVRDDIYDYIVEK